MCQLLGLCFNREVTMRLSFSGFRRRGIDNPDGWGAAWYRDDALNLVKEPLPAHESIMAKHFLTGVSARSTVFLAHVRFSTHGAVDYTNTHPFYRRLNGRSWVFAHNGSLRGLRSISSGRYLPIGETDSELLFCHVLEWMSANWAPDPSRADYVSLHQKLMDLNRFGTLNAVLSDGKTLLAYHDRRGHKGLHYVRREAPFGRIRMQDEDFTVNLGDDKDPGERGYIVATVPLSDEEWCPLRPAQLLAFSNGELVFSSDVWSEDEAGTLLIAILRILRESPHRVRLSQISQASGIPLEKCTSLIQQLVNSNLVQQDSRDSVQENHPDASFFTVSSRRSEIDRILNSGRFAVH